MTPKELLYIEDALGHEKQMKTVCGDFAMQLQDSELKNFVSSLACKYNDAYAKFYSLLGNC